MSASIYRYFLVCLTAVLLTQCGPEVLDVELRRVLEHDGSWHDISLMADGVGYAIGGDTWQRGDLAMTNDFGESWTVQSITDKGMYGLDISGTEKLAVGIDGQILSSGNGGDWRKWRTPFWNILLDLDVHPTAKYAVAVGGQRFKKGVIKTFRTNDFSVIHFDTLDKGLATVIHLGDDLWIAAGFGVVLRTENGGADWDINYPKEAYFTCLYVGDGDFVWMGSQYGGLWRSDDEGKTWSEMRKAQTAFSSISFRDITQDDQGVLWLAGDRGTLAYSTNDGEDLNYLKIPEAYDIRALSIVERHIILATRSGEILSVTYPEEL